MTLGYTVQLEWQPYEDNAIKADVGSYTYYIKEIDGLFYVDGYRIIERVLDSHATSKNDAIAQCIAHFRGVINKAMGIGVEMPDREEVEQTIKDLKEQGDLKNQIDRLANFIMAEVPGEPSQDQGAVDTAIRIMKEHMAQPTPSEVLFAFLGWLTSRSEAVTFSSRHEAPVAVDLVGKFIDANGFAEPRSEAPALKFPE